MLAILNECGFRHGKSYLVGSYREIAEFFGSAERTIRDWSQDPTWPYERPGTGRRAVYDLRVVVQWAYERWCEKVDPSKDSPALERMREAKAKIAELDLAERQAQLVARSTADSALEQSAAVYIANQTALRERLIQLYPDAADQISEELGMSCNRLKEALRLSNVSAVDPIAADLAAVAE